MYRPITPIDTTAVNATVTPSLLPFSAGSVRISASTAHDDDRVERDLPLVDLAPELRARDAPSRLNAYIMREALVRQLMPQNSWPTSAMIRIDFTQAVRHRARRRRRTTVPPPSLTAFGVAVPRT